MLSNERRGTLHCCETVSLCEWGTKGFESIVWEICVVTLFLQRMTVYAVSGVLFTLSVHIQHNSR